VPTQLESFSPFLKQASAEKRPSPIARGGPSFSDQRSELIRVSIRHGDPASFPEGIRVEAEAPREGAADAAAGEPVPVAADAAAEEPVPVAADAAAEEPVPVAADAAAEEPVAAQAAASRIYPEGQAQFPEDTKVSGAGVPESEVEDVEAAEPEASGAEDAEVEAEASGPVSHNLPSEDQPQFRAGKSAAAEAAEASEAEGAGAAEPEASGAEDAEAAVAASAPASHNLQSEDQPQCRAGKSAEAEASEVEVAEVEDVEAAEPEASGAEDAEAAVAASAPASRNLPSEDQPQCRAGKSAEAEAAEVEGAGVAAEGSEVEDAEELESDAEDARNLRSEDRGSCPPGKNPDTTVHPCDEARMRAKRHPNAGRKGTSAADSSPRVRNGRSPDGGTRRSGTTHNEGSSGCRQDRSTHSIHRCAGEDGTCSCSSTSSSPMSKNARPDGTYSNTRRSTHSSCRCATKRNGTHGVTSRRCSRCCRCKAHGRNVRSSRSSCS
jgi:hypothetical protein